MDHGEIASLCRKILCDTLGIKEVEIQVIPWDRFIYDFALENAGNSDSGWIYQKFKTELDQFLSQLKAVRGFWENACQRHHDYYVFLYRQGNISEEDMPNYHLAMQRERKGLVKPLPKDAVSPFG
jgi:hypothetical protein